MSKTDRKKRLKARKRESSETIRKGEILAKTPKRKPGGRRKEPEGGWGQAGPTPEVAERRKELLPTGRGCSDDWIDVAESTGLLAPRLAEGLRRYRGLIRAFARKTAAPALSAMADVHGYAMESQSEEDEVRRIRQQLDSISHEIKALSWRDADTLEACIRGPAMPTSAQMARIQRAAVPVAEFFGI